LSEGGDGLNFQDSWTQIKNQIISKNQKNKTLAYWFDSTDFAGLEQLEDRLVIKLSVPSELHQYWISQHLMDAISSEISCVCTVPFVVSLVVIPQDVPQPDDFPTRIGVEPEVQIVPDVVQKTNVQRDSLNTDYTFGTFVVGRNTEFAHAVSYSIANKPGAENYNPLFICGPTGMGKTHLLNAVGNHVREQFPHLKIRYCSAESFLNECVHSIRRNEMHNFRKKYRESCQMLLMDDIQILGRGEAVQEEFFHTLNDFFSKGHQVIVASDRMPKDIQGLEDRIRTRLEWGLVADISMPDLETRMAILRYKAEKRKLILSHEVINYIARISKTSVRQLEGNLNKIKMYSELTGMPISLDLAKKVLATHDDSRNLTIDDIMKLTSEHFRIRVQDLKAKSRSQPLVRARQLSMYLSKKNLDISLVEIGRAFGGKDHSTVINALRRVEDQLITNVEIKKDFNDLQGRIHNITGV
jgi:chromosomal replication initiator protein